MIKTFLKILILIFVTSFVILHCGGAEPPTRGKTIGELTNTDWTYNNDGTFDTCPIIYGFDDDGDCIANIDDPNPYSPDKWQDVCHAKYSSMTPAQAENLCMNDYNNALADAGGPDMDEMLMMALAPNLGQLLGASAGLLDTIGGWFGGGGDPDKIKKLKPKITPDTSYKTIYPKLNFKEADIVGTYKMVSYENSDKKQDGWMIIEDFSTKSARARGKSRQEKSEPYFRGGVIFDGENLLFVFETRDDKDKNKFLFPSEYSYYNIRIERIICDGTKSDKTKACPSVQSYLQDEEKMEFGTMTAPICPMEYNGNLETSYKSVKDLCENVHGKDKCSVRVTLPLGVVQKFSLYGVNQETKKKVKIEMEKVAKSATAYGAAYCYSDNKNENGDTFFEVKN